MFFEVMNAASGHGDIGCATSMTGTEWKYEGIVLNEPFHISFPCVFMWEDTVYMIPESAADEKVCLYRAVSFPRKWEKTAVLVRGRLADSVIFRRDGTWWIMSCGAPHTHDTLRLFMSPSLRGPFREHPCSPLVAGDGRTARPAGRVIRFRGELIRFSQNSVPTYGRSVSAFEISALSGTDYGERPVDGGRVLDAGDRGWNRHGMHHIDAHMLENGTWIACVDGYRKFLNIRFEY
jgi:hypothetical protein